MADRSRPSRKGWIAGGLAVVAILLVLGYAAMSFVVYDGVGTVSGECDAQDVANTPTAFAVRPGYDQAIANANVMPAPRDVTFASRNPQIPDAKLAGWWIPGDAADAPTVIMVHGIYSCRREANILVPAGMLHRAGFSVLLMDLRDHGDSEGDDRSGRSIAFVHGALDKVLPSSMTLELHDAAVKAGATTPDAWVVAGAGHTEAVFTDPAGYEQRLVAFFTAALGAP